MSTQNRKIFKHLIDHHTVGKAIPGVLGQGEEFVNMKVRSKKEFEFMQSIKSNPEIKPAIPKQTEGERAVQVKPICLLMAYMQGSLDEKALQEYGLKEDLETILRAMPSYLDILLEEAMTLVAELKARQTHKRITCQNILGVIQFS